ncbi:MAG: hypothetical protein R3E97_16045 [Candidatus Eisenbacteria bacterium]
MKVLLSTLLFVPFLVPTSIARAEGIEYPLAEFRTTDIVRNSLFVSASVNPTFTSISRDERWPAGSYERESDTSTGNLGFRVEASRLVDRPTTIYRLDLSVSHSPDLRSEELRDIHRSTRPETKRTWSRDRTTDGYNGRFEASGSHRDYLVGPWFREVGASAQVWWNYLSFETTESSSDYVSEQHSGREVRRQDTSIEVPLRVGVGRIQEVSHARTALYILDGLSELGYLLRVPEPQVIDDLANRLREVENDRVFDSREHRIHEYREIVSFLQNRGLIGDVDVEAYASIKDNWRYVIHEARGSGLEASAGATYARFDREEHGKRTGDDEPTFVDNVDLSGESLAFDIRVVHQSPLSKTLQLDEQFELRFIDADSDSDGLQSFDSDDMRWGIETDGTTIEASAGVDATYYPTSRDAWKLELSASYAAHVTDERRQNQGVESITANLRRDTNQLLVSTSWNRSLSLQTKLVTGYGVIHESWRDRDTAKDGGSTRRSRNSQTDHFMYLACEYEIF